MSALPRPRRLLAVGVAAAVTGTGAFVSLPAATAAGAAAHSVSTAQRVAVPSTTTLVADPRTSEYGEQVEATATVTSPGAAPAGSVTFLLDGSATTVDTDPQGVATLLLDDTRVGDHTISATFVPTDPTQVAGSASGPQDLTVVKAPTRTRISVPRTTPGERTRATVRVRGAHRTVPTGRVKVVLREVGQPGTVELRYGALLEGRRGFYLGRLSAGRYRVKAIYRGNVSHRRSADTVRFRVPR